METKQFSSEAAQQNETVDLTHLYRKPFIPLNIHEQLKEVSQFFGYYYDTSSGLLNMNGKQHRFIMIGENLYLQYKKEHLVSLKSLHRNMTYIESLKETFHHSHIII